MVDELRGQFPNQIIRASAGTGKTFELSNRYLKLLASGAQCETILATTFTKKGAGEILDRIIERLSDAALDDAAARKLSGELEFVLTRERAAKILADLVANLHRLEISTLDSFFNRVAKAFALELRLPPTWDIVDEQQIKRMNDEAIHSVLRNGSVINLLHMLSKGEASRRVATMIRDTVDNIYTVYRESGDKPWDEIPAVGKLLKKKELESIELAAEAIEPEKAGLKKQWNVVKELVRARDWEGLLKATSFKNWLDGNPRFGKVKLSSEILAVFGQIRPHMEAVFSQRLISQNHSTRDLLSAFGTLLEKAKDETGAIRFDDVTERLVSFVSMWDTERFSFRLDHQIQHLLLDEFQDTSLAQWKIIRPFAQAVTSNPELLRSFFCVGDMKQAIFGWRGGVAEIFDLVDDELPNLEETKKRTASYRSSQPVIDMVNGVFDNVKKYACDKEIYNEAIYQWGQDWFEHHSTNRADLPGYVTIEMAGECGPQQKFPDTTKDRARNRKMINKTIAKIRDLLRTIPSHHDIGVIVRTNAEVGTLIGRLQEAGIPASEEGGNPITDSAAVELVLSALTLADHPGDSVARFHLSHSPLAERFGLEPESPANKSENAKAAQLSAAQLRSDLVADGYGPTIESMARLILDQCTERETIQLQHLVRIAYDKPSQDDQWELRPSRFVDYIRNEIKVSDQRSAQVRVMTIHKCKGLEFDVVVLPMKVSTSGWAGMTPSVVVGREHATAPVNTATRYAGESIRKLLPVPVQEMFERDRQRNVRESMCVLYVALTRAVHATHVIVSHGAKPDHKSPAGILMATLCPEAERAEGILYEHGDDRWFEKTTTTDSPDPFGLDEFYMPDSVSLNPGTISKEVRSGRGLPRSSPSQGPGGDTMQLRSIFENSGSGGGLTRGTMIHACFELVRWVDESIPTREQLRTHLQATDPTIENVNRYIDEFNAMLKHDNIRSLLSRSDYQESYLLEFAKPDEIMLEANRLEVQTERRFAVQTPVGFLEGLIDRLVLVYQGDKIVAADVIELKTDQVDPAELQGLIEHYTPQLNGYREAVARFASLPIEKVSTRMLFVATGQVVNLDLIDAVVGAPKPNTRKRTERAHASGRSTKPKLDYSEGGQPASKQRPPAAENVDSETKRQGTLWD